MSDTITVRLTRPQIQRVLESLWAHFAGDVGEGDLCWTIQQAKTAARAQAILQDAVRDSPK